MLLNNTNIKFVEETHQYFRHDGQELFGITGVISRQLFPDKYKNVPKNILQNKARRGQEIHNQCFTYDMFGTIESMETEMYANLKNRENFNVIDSEYLVSDLSNFATAIDKVFTFDGYSKNEVDICDIKTTYKLDKQYISWQLSIGKYLFNLNNPKVKVKKLYTIWIKDKAELIEIEEKPIDQVIKLLECEIKGVRFLEN